MFARFQSGHVIDFGFTARRDTEISKQLKHVGWVDLIPKSNEV
jgi:hypothetical protein